MAQLVYIDETGSVGSGGKSQPFLTLVAAVVDETKVKALAGRMHELAMEHLGWVPAEFEFHGYDVWHGHGYWQRKAPSELLSAYEAVVGLIQELDAYIVHATIDKLALHRKHDGQADPNAYRLALQFMLEKLDRWRPEEWLRILVADEAKQERVSAIKMVADLQSWSVGEVPGRQLTTIIDSMHFVESTHSPGVQLADMCAFIVHRARLETQGHPDADDAVARMRMAISDRTPTYRMPWPSS